MTAYATVSELEIEMRTTFSTTDEAYAESVLARVGSYLAQLVDVDPSDAQQAENLKYVSLYMARRIMERQQAADVAQQTIQAGSYSETQIFAQPYSTDRLWKLLIASGYAKLLGIGGGIGFARPSYGILESDEDDD